MSYLAQSQMVDDHHLIGRIAACAATQGIIDARIWTVQHMWALSAQPGWGSTYAAATADDPVVEAAAWHPRAGINPDVITDEMILAGVTAMLQATAVPEADSPPQP